MLGNGISKVSSQIGLIDVRTNGVCPDGYVHSQKWLNTLLAPSLEVATSEAAYIPWWELIFERMSQSYTGVEAVSGATLLCGESAAVDAALRTWKFLPDSQHETTEKYYHEMDVSSLSDRYSTSMLVGATPGYIGYKEGGSPFIQTVKEILTMQAEFDDESEGETWERPVPVLVFKNVHRAHASVQAVLATIAKGHITTADGEKIELSGAQVVFTAPGIRPRGAEGQVSGKAVSDGLIELVGAEGKLFAPELIESSLPIHFPEPTLKDLLALTSCEVGRACLSRWIYRTKSKTTLRHYGDAGSVALAVKTAALTPGMTWGEMVAAVKAAASQIAEVEAGPVLEDAPPLTCGTLWGRTTEGTLYPHTVDLMEISSLESRFEVPADFAERSGIKVSPSAYWADLAGIEEKVKTEISGQDKVVDSLLSIAKNRLSGVPVSTPLLTAILVGPTGTGKTALPKAIAAATGHPEILIDCNTISSEEALAEAIFGQDEGSLYTRIRRSPASVVLLDEVDKAPASIWNRLMSMLETGEIRDTATGKTVCLRHCMVFLASNYLAAELRTVASQLAEMQRTEMDSTLRGMLSRSANINEACLERLDGAFLMMPLEGESACGIWKKFLAKGLQETYPGIIIPDEVALWAETRHLDAGSAAGARARRRSADELVAGVGNNGLISVNQLNVEHPTLCLTSAAREAFFRSGGPRSERQRLWGNKDGLVASLRERYKGSTWQVAQVADAIALSGRKLKPRGPVAVILLCGPTGGGKTFLGEQIARACGKGDAVKIECQQAVNADAVSAMLFGDNDGHGGALSRPLILKKDRVVVFDEFSRAHKSFMDQVMNVLDEGRALDTQTGLPVDMRQGLFFLTTNAASERMEEEIFKKGISGAAAEDVARKILVEAGVLAPEHAERMTLILPVCRQESPAEEVEFVSGIIRGVLEEFGISEAKAASYIQECIAAGVAKDGARAIRRWTEKKIPA